MKTFGLKKILFSFWFLICTTGISETFNEWTFEPDSAGLTLPQANNAGVDGAVFAGQDNGLLLTDGNGGLLATYNATSNGLWSEGAILDAPLTAISSGVRYLRYDFEYDLNSTNNNSGTILALGFFDDSLNVASLVFSYDVSGVMVPPAGTELVPVSEELFVEGSLAGAVSAIAKVDLDNQQMSVWYDLSGTDSFDEDNPAANNVQITINSLNDLHFRATGDFRPAGSTDFVNIDNIRMADSWAAITADLPDFSAGPDVQLVSVTMTNDAGTAGTNVGDTNTISVIIQNLSAPADNITSTFTPPDGAEAWFAMTSNNAPVTLAYPESATNIYTVVANPDTPSGTYLFDVTVTADGGISLSETFSLTVGSLVRYLSNTVTEISGGRLAGKYEPGETLNVEIFNINDGANDLTNVINALYAGSSTFFTISNITSSVYADLPIGTETSTVYSVYIEPDTSDTTYGFTVSNRVGAVSWPPGEFFIEVYNRAVPGLSPTSITLNLAEGAQAQDTVTITNSGNASLNFTITNNAVWSRVLSVNTAATPSTQRSGGTALPLVGPSPAQASYAGESDTIVIGFAFPFYGTTYSNLYVDSNGAILLSNSTLVNNTAWADGTTGDLPRGSRPLIAPFRNKQLVIPDANPIRYIRRTNPDSLVLIYNGATFDVAPAAGTNLQFQAELFADGQIKFSYYNINGSLLDTVAVGLQGSASSYTNFNFVPTSGTAVLVAPEENRWVTYSPTNGTVSAFGSTNIVFTADGTDQTSGTANAFTAAFNWSSGGSSNVAVSASVVAAVPLLVTPANVLFYGNAGDIASTTMFLSNAGTATLNFTITDTNKDAAAYQGAVSLSTNWTDISTNTTLNMLDPHENPYITATNDGFSALQPIGFAFPFYGGVYTQFSAGVNGGISLGATNRISAGNNFGTSREDIPQRFIAPYWGNLFLDANASIRFRSTTNELVVTWQNMEQQGIIPGSDLTFQAVLYASGHIEFRYQQINGSSWHFTKWGARSGSTQSTSSLLMLPGDETVTTNEYGYLKTNVVSAISNRMVSITSSNYPVITYTPSQGTIPVGGAAPVTLHGNASGLTPGSPFNSITNTADLNITYEVTNNVVSVTFVATNSVGATIISPLASALDEDGDGMSYDDELIAGTDPLDSSSVLVIKTDAGRDLSWVAAPGRTYTVLYTLDLNVSFQPLEGAIGLTTNRFVDAVHLDVSVIYYKVTVD